MSGRVFHKSKYEILTTHQNRTTGLWAITQTTSPRRETSGVRYNHVCCNNFRGLEQQAFVDFQTVDPILERLFFWRGKERGGGDLLKVETNCSGCATEQTWIVWACKSDGMYCVILFVGLALLCHFVCFVVIYLLR